MAPGSRRAAGFPTIRTRTVPAILEYLPYRKRDGTRPRDQGLHMYLRRARLCAIRLDIRGTGDSEGLIDDEYTVQEQLDGCAAIEWIAQQDWCDGQVAMIGISWGGFNGLQIAARQPPALKDHHHGRVDRRPLCDRHPLGRRLPVEGQFRLVIHDVRAQRPAA